MADRQRPLSPHLQIYRWTITMASSILHRATGLALAAGTLLLAAWLIGAASGPDIYQCVNAFLVHPLGLFIMLGFTFSLFFHLLNGVRHLFWDAGYGFEIRTATLSGWAVLIGAVILTAAVWIIGLGLWEVG